MSLTPNRSVSITFDHAETQQQEPFYSRRRDRFAIRPEERESVEQLASGVWILKPNETSLSFLANHTAGHASIRRLGDCQGISLLTEIPMQRQYTELTGLSPASGVASAGDHFMIKRVPAGQTWNVALISSSPSPALAPVPDQPMDRQLEFKSDAAGGIDEADTGYVIRWLHPSAPLAFSDYLWTFMFGGSLTPGGFGRFALTIGGAGRALLFEWVAGAWAQVDEWTWAPAAQIPGRMHTMRILPHAARWIEFQATSLGQTDPGGRMTSYRPAGLHGESSRPHAHLYEAANRAGIAPAPGGARWNMTGPGQFAFDARRDMRFPFQIARLTYPASGYLVEAPFRLPNTPGTLHALEVLVRSLVLRTGSGAPRGSVTPEPIDAATDTSLAPQTETYSEGGVTKTIAGYECPAAPHAVKVKLILATEAGTTHVSPWLLGYEVRRRGEFATPTATPLTITSAHFRQSPCTRLEIDSGDEDPSHARASLRISDLTNRLARVRNRGELPLRITTTYDPADQAKLAVIFEGYAVKPVATLRGNLSSATYPSPHWHDLRVECLGKWAKFQKRDYPKQVLSFAWDPAAPPDPKTNGPRPWKVTDAARHLLQVIGIPDAQIDVPDLPTRFWSNGDPDQEHLRIQVGQPVLEFVSDIAAFYLNYFLVFDANAGDAGKWRLRPAPRLSDPVTWAYQSDGPAAGRVMHLPQSYDAGTTFMTSFESWPLAPLGNWLQVTAGLGDAAGRHYTVQVRNPLSYNLPGEATADPDSEDYLGYLSPLYRRIDGRITTPEAAKFVARVTFERACRAQRYGRLTSPAPLIDAAALEPATYTTYRRRPHLYGDHITIDGEDWFVTGCHWDVRRQHAMRQTLEVQRFNAPLSYEAPS